MVVGAGVVDAMFDTFPAEPDRPQWEGLLAALEAGKRAGGQPDGEQSAGLYVVDREPFATVGLRVDLFPEPVRELRRLADRYFPLIPYYGLRPFDPDVPRAEDWLRRARADGFRSLDAIRACRLRASGGAVPTAPASDNARLRHGDGAHGRATAAGGG